MHVLCFVTCNNPCLRQTQSIIKYAHRQDHCQTYYTRLRKIWSVNLQFDEGHMTQEPKFVLGIVMMIVPQISTLSHSLSPSRNSTTQYQAQMKNARSDLFRLKNSLNFFILRINTGRGKIECLRMKTWL